MSQPLDDAAPPRLSPAVNPLLAAVDAPPIAAVRGWVAGRSFPADKPLIDLTQAVPGYPPPPELARHLAERLMDPQVHRYTEILGMPALRQAHAAHLTDFYGAPVAAEQVAITAGCNQAFCVAMLALAQAGDEVILPLPWYFNHRMWLDMLGIRAVPLAFRPESGGVPDPEEAARAIGPRTRAIVLISPNNPTGAVYPPPVIRAFFEVARHARVALVIDETYKDFLPEDGRPHDLFADPDWPGTLVHLYSFSKMFALTGYRVGSLTASAAFVAQVHKVMDCVAICAPRLGQEAALYGLGKLGPWVRANTLAMRRRAQEFRQALQRLNGLRLVSLGAYFAYLEHPGGGQGGVEVSDVDVAKRLALEENLLMLPGSTFGPGQERYIRLAFANAPEDAVPAILERLGR